jgi:hypothetical protein
MMCEMCREWLNWLKEHLTSKNMSKKTDQIRFHSTSTGRLYLKEEELIKTAKFKNLINQLLESPLYKRIKDKTRTTAA